MGENEELGWFPRYIGVQPICNDVGCTTQVRDGSQMPSAEGNVKVESSDAKFLIPPTKSCGNGFYVVDELTKLPKDIIRTNISTDDADFKRLSEETAKAFEKSCNDYLETLSEVSKSLSPCLDRLIAQLTKPTKRKKHYKPKFTL